MSPKLEQALALIREDRPESVDQALALLQNTVYSFSMKVCGHPEDAEDTMQDVLLKVLPYLPKFENPQALSVWLYKVARNRCLMNRRGVKNARHRHVSLEELMPTPSDIEHLTNTSEPDPESSLLQNERDARVRTAIQTIPPAYRMTLVLHDMEGLSTSQVAEVTGVREGTVRVRLHRARLMLRQELERRARGKASRSTQSRAISTRKGVSRPRHCRDMFASLSDYMDGLATKARNREMEKHLGDCKPCVAFLENLKSAVNQCREYQPPCDSTRASELRRQLMTQYRAAVAALPKAKARR